MVGISERSQPAAIRLQVVNHLFGRCNPREQQHMFVAADVIEFPFTAAVCRHEFAVLQRGEVEFLVGIQVHGFGDDPELHGAQVLGAFGHDDDVGPGLAVAGFSQPACRQQLVVDDETMVIHEQDVDARLDIAVLEGIVEQDHVGFLGFFIVGEPIDAMAAFLVHRHKDVGKLLLHLIGLVSDVLHPRVLVSQHISPTLALVATAENGHLCPMLQQTDKVFHMRGLARAAHGDIAHRDDRGLEAAALQNAQFEQLVSQPHPQSVKPAQWQKPFSNLDKVAFHLLSLFVLKYLMFRRDDCHAALFDVQVERYACLYGVAVTDVFHHHEAAIAVAKDGLQFAVDIAPA